jgi:hypothetical protein
MNKNWLFREEFYRSLHRWPIIIAFIALGCLSGWGCSLIWPTYYRATSQIYVGLNPYRTYSDANFLALSKPRYANLDNYLYWQMYQLEGAIFLQDFIQETLDRLQQTDTYWKNSDSYQLMNILDAEWRTAGLWSLNAEHSDPARASQAVRAWSEVVVERVKESVQSSRNTFMIDYQLQVVVEKLEEDRLRQQDLRFTKISLLEWRRVNQDLPKTQPMKPDERWHILYLGTHLAKFTPSWQSLLENQPSEDSPQVDYFSWIDQIIQQIDADLAPLEQQITDLEEKQDVLEKEYSLEADKSLGLSPNLEIKEVKDLPTKIIRPTSTLALIGGIIGLLIWVLCQLVIITNRVKDQ